MKKSLIIFTILLSISKIAFAGENGISNISWSSIPNEGALAFICNTETTCQYTDQNPIQANSYPEGYYGLTLGYSCAGLDYDTCVGGGIKKYLYVKDNLWYIDINAPEDVMSAKAIRNLILKYLSDFSLALLAIVSACIVIGIGVLIFRNGWQLIQGTTMPDVARMGWNNVDKFFYKPWKGYKRYRSRKWNMEHMP